MTRVLDPRHAPVPVRLVCDRCGRRSGWHKQGRSPRDWIEEADGSHRCQRCRFKPHHLAKRRRRERREEAQRRVDLMRVYDD